MLYLCELCIPLPSMRHCCLAILMGLCGLLWPHVGLAQVPDADVPRASQSFAIVGATVVQAPGRVLENTTVVFRNGLITAVGTNVPIPADARRIEGDSLFVYAGFIDAFSHTGIPRPEAPAQAPTVRDPGNPSAEVAGFFPERRAAALVRPNDGSIDALRRAGFTMAHIAPHGGYMSGQTALLLLHAENTRPQILRDGHALAATWTPSRNAYPSTSFAIMARWRDLMPEVRRRMAEKQRYAQNPAGRTRVEPHVSLDALEPVARQEQSVFFHSEDPLQVHRVLQIASQQSVRMIPAGVEYLRDIPASWRQMGIPVVLSLTIPDKPEAPSDSIAPLRRVEDATQLASERSALAQRRVEAWQSRAELAATLHQADVRFAFSTRGLATAAILKAIRTYIEAGLAEDVALAALTTHPAELLGVSAQMGTVEVGKMANLVVSRSSLLGKNGAVHSVIVEGIPYTYPAPAARARTTASASNGESMDVRGGWSMTVTAQGTEFTGRMRLEGPTPDQLSGTLTIDQMGGQAIPLQNLVLTGQTASFSFNVPGAGEVSGTITFQDATQFRGSLEIGAMGSATMRGTKDPS